MAQLFSEFDQVNIQINCFLNQFSEMNQLAKIRMLVASLLLAKQILTRTLLTTCDTLKNYSVKHFPELLNSKTSIQGSLSLLFLLIKKKYIQLHFPALLILLLTSYKV